VTTLADAYDALAEAAAALALEIRAYADGGGMPPERAPEPTSATQAPSFEELPFDEQWTERDEPSGQLPIETPHGSAAVCPAHNIPYRSGRNNSKFCPSVSDDPKWRNDKGYCQITPKSAAAWLRQKAGASA